MLKVAVLVSGGGTNLQAIALQYYLRNQGYEVSVINYEVPSSGAKIKDNKKSLLKKVLYQPEKYAIRVAEKIHKAEITERNVKLSNAIKDKCMLTKKIKDEKELIETCNAFDLLICGSDQIWNPNWYNRFYFADYAGVKTRRISYAPSMGVNEIPETIIPEISRSIKNFDCISVRERRAAELLSPYASHRPEVVVDPTLLLFKEDWNKIFPQIKRENKNYVLALFLSDEKIHLHAAKRFAKSRDCKFILIPYKGITYLQSGDVRANAGLEDLLDLIRCAKYILTDSFHITVFSIIYRKQFFTFQRFKENSSTSQNVRITNLLELVGLKSRYISYKTKYIENTEYIEYEKHIVRLNKEIEKSKDFLLKSIES